MTASEAITARGSRLAGPVSRKHDRQCSERHRCQPVQTFQPIHGDASLSLFPLFWTAPCHGRFGPILRKNAKAGREPLSAWRHHKNRPWEGLHSDAKETAECRRLK